MASMEKTVAKFCKADLLNKFVAWTMIENVLHFHANNYTHLFLM